MNCSFLGSFGDAMEKSITKAIEERRSFYSIGREIILPDDKIIELVHNAVRHAPSAFNSQSARVLVLLGNEHDMLWSFTSDILRGIVPAESFTVTQARLDSFRNGYGTVLFFEDQATVSDLQRKFTLYKDNFPLWSLQSSGMLQYIVWTTLETEGYGASLQHYNPLIDERVREAWNVPESWKLLAEMPFGTPIANPDAKTFLPVEDRVKVFK